MPKLSAHPRRFVIAGAVALATTSACAVGASAAPLQSCKLEQAIYEATPRHGDESGGSIIEFFRDFIAQKTLGKSGVLRSQHTTGFVDYDVFTAWAPGLARPYFFIAATRGATNVLEDRAVTSVILPFGADFRPPSSNERAPTYLVIPRLARDFHYWHEEHEKYTEKVIPAIAWKLKTCRGSR